MNAANILENSPKHSRHRVLGTFSVAVILALSALAWSSTRQNSSISSSNPLNLQNFKEYDNDLLDTKTPYPNIILFLADDQGFADVGYNAESDTWATFTPFIDRLAQNSIRLGNYYAESLCTPARAALLTGKYPIHNSMQYKVVEDASPFGLPLTHKLLPEHLESIGYRTHIIGKWHLGHFNADYLPLARGFASHTGYYTSQVDYYNHDVIEDGRDSYVDFHFNQDPFESDEYAPSVYMREVERLLENHDQEHPFFLYYSQQLPHMPLDVPPEGFIHTKQITTAQDEYGGDRQIFAKMTAALDKTMEHLVEELQGRNMYENTVIIYASDNGGCSAYGANNYPLKGQKNSMYEGGVKVNAFIHSPLIPLELRGGIYEQLFHKVDWLPTIFQGILGRDTPDLGSLDGINQWGNLMQTDDDYRLEILHNLEIHQDYPNTFRTAIRAGAFKLVYGEFEAEWYSSAVLSSCATCCEGSSSPFPHRTEIYNIHVDMKEEYNIYLDVDDSILTLMWDKLDGYWDSMVHAAYTEATSTVAYQAWRKAGWRVVPWITDN